MQGRQGRTQPESRAPDWEVLRHGLSGSNPVAVLLGDSETPTRASYDTHYAVELGVVLSGRVLRHVQSWKAELGPGQVWLCGMWEPHGHEVLASPYQCVVFEWLPQMLIAPLLEAEPRRDWLAPFAVPPGQRPQAQGGLRQRALAVGREVVDKLALPEPARGLWLRLLSLELLLLVRRGWEAPAPALPPRPYHLEVLRTALDLVLVRQGKVEVGEAARACGASRSTLGRAFTQYMGLSFAPFALRYRLDGAATRLLQTRDPIKAVALDWGFTDESHLHRHFLRCYGCSPGRYRRQHLSTGLPSPPPPPRG